MYNHIIDNIYIGDMMDARLHNKQFDHIFTVAQNPLYTGNHYYPLIDGYHSTNYSLLLSAIKDLVEIHYDNPSNKILVHCVVGSSRSASVIAGYMITDNNNLDLCDAIYYMKKIRPIINPEPHLIKILKQYKEELNNGIINPHSNL